MCLLTMLNSSQFQQKGTPITTLSHLEWFIYEMVFTLAANCVESANMYPIYPVFTVKRNIPYQVS